MNKKDWVYGINPVLEAIRAGRVSLIYLSKKRQKDVQKVLSIAKSQGIPFRLEEEDFFDQRFGKGHQGIAATVKSRRILTIDEILEIPIALKENPFFLILDEIEDPRNFGAILRVADAAGVHGVIFPSHRSAPITTTVSKASAGAVEFVNMAQVVNIKHAIEKMKRMDITIFGAEAGSELTPWEMDMKIPLAIVIGSEARGIRETVKKACDFILSLPLKGMVNSLNVSVATGIIAYEVVRQRTGLKVMS